MKTLTILTATAAAIVALLIAMPGCGMGKNPDKANDRFFTSGDREADQRAQQRMAKAEQLSGEGENAGSDKRKTVTGAQGEKAVVAAAKTTLFERLGGDTGLNAIVNDFVDRAMADPRVNWARKGVHRGGFVRAGDSVAWDASAANVQQLKKHIVQTLSIATGGPATYDGPPMKQAHASLHISNAEFDAAIGDLKATLDKLQVPNKEQKELLAIVESTRTEVVTER
jgi:hemoglobin